jgi:hypothetical protein
MADASRPHDQMLSFRFNLSRYRESLLVLQQQIASIIFISGCALQCGIACRSPDFAAQ